ncbi:MAG: amidohydrolase, partial [Bacteroidetes bacterium]
LVPASAGVDPNENGFFGVNFVDKVDTTLIPELAQMTREHQVWIVPTQSLMVRWTKIEDPQITLQEEGMQYMSLETRSSWGRRKSTMLKALNNDPERVERFIAIRQQIIRGLKAAGVDFLLGSDAPQVFNVPGFSIQHEMQSMVEAGLTPYEVLVSGTLNPARYFGEEGAYGSLVEGASADLILLEANPLEDIAHVRQQAGVMVRGKWLPREYIDERLAQIAQKYADVAKK